MENFLKFYSNQKICKHPLIVSELPSLITWVKRFIINSLMSVSYTIDEPIQFLGLQCTLTIHDVDFPHFYYSLKAEWNVFKIIRNWPNFRNSSNLFFLSRIAFPHTILHDSVGGSNCILLDQNIPNEVVLKLFMWSELVCFVEWMDKIHF